MFKIVSPQFINVLENESISLFAPATANPAVTRYKWSRKRYPLNVLQQVLKKKKQKKKKNFIVENEFLNISRAQRDDSGSYTCTAFNEHGSSTVAFQVTVSCKLIGFIMHLTLISF